MSFKVKDYYYKKAKKEKFLARSIYKLEEIDKKYKVIPRGGQVLDLGYYPGSWMQYLSQQVGQKGVVVGLDVQPVNEELEKLSNVKVFEMDAFNVKDLLEVGVSQKFDVVCSDMAPKTSGIKSLDQDRSLMLVETVFSLLPQFLKAEGNLVIKVFESHDAQVFLKAQKKEFKEFHYLRPKSTRSTSKEFFVIGKGYKG